MQVTNSDKNRIVIAVEDGETLTVSSDQTPESVKIYFKDASVFSCYRQSNLQPLLIEVK